MIQQQKIIKNKEAYKCPACSQDTHIWHETYYEEGVILLKANKSYITWCSNVREYVITNKRV